MKKKIIIGTVLTGMLFATSPVEAMGNAKVMFTSRDNIQVGDTFTVSMSVTDINDTYDGIVSLGGNLSFDSSMVEYVSSKGIETPYLFQINEDYGYKIAGLDFTLDNGICETLTVYEFTFKALKEGNTTITLTNTKLTDSKDYINTVVLGKDINIEEKQEIIVEKETVIEETPIVETEIKQVTNKEVKTDKVVNNEVKETKKEENTEVEEKTIEVNNDKKEENIVEKTEIKEEKVTFIKKIQQVFNDLFNTLRNLFK